MARKELRYTVESEGRDQGKIFLVKEMPATQAEKWALRCFFAIGSSGIEISEMDKRLGIAGLIRHGLTALMKVPFNVAEPLLDEMLQCVQIQPSAVNSSIVRPMIDGDIEEIRTYFDLRKAVFQLHTDFFTNGAASTSASAPSQRTQKSSLSIKTRPSKSQP